MEWSLPAARALAAGQLSAMGERWQHVEAVGVTCEALVVQHGIPAYVGCAAWLHDVGYAPALALSGFHALDGARFLTRAGAPAEVECLVAHHSGAEFEAAERGLSAQLAEFQWPPPSHLDVLTLVDMTTGPDGQPVSVMNRLEGILSRYERDDPVHRAVSRSWDDLVASCERAKRALGLADEWRVTML